jgi:hypothetical protein
MYLALVDERNLGSGKSSENSELDFSVIICPVDSWSVKMFTVFQSAAYLPSPFCGWELVFWFGAFVTVS